jgi:intein/homing endonuclease
MRTKYTTNEIDFLKKNFNILSRKEIGKILKRTPAAIKSICRRLSIKHNKDEILNKQIKYSKKQSGQYNVNEKKFINDIDDVAAYLLGLIWADGHLHKKIKNDTVKYYALSISLKESDANYVDELLINTGKWTKTKYKNQIAFTCYNRILGEFLELHDYLSKSKTSPCKILSHIPIDLHKYFFLGYLDGDGCIYNKNKKITITFTSTYEQDWKFMEKLLQNMDIKYYIRRVIKNNTAKYSDLRIHKKDHCSKFLSYLYDKHSLGFIRKKMKFENFKNSMNVRLPNT